nr:zinc ABC transporter substrate-binding protein [Desulfovibrio sp.]
PTPEDAKKVAQADLVVMNGLHLEGWIDRLVQASGCKAPVVIASAGITPLSMDDEDGSGAKVTDPHAWQDLEIGMRYVENILAGLSAADPAHAGDYAKNAEAYRAKLAAMHAWVKEEFARIPEARRTIITSHDAFGYLAHAYGVTLLSPMGVSTESEASAKNVAELIRQIKREKVTALFVENMTDPRLMESITRETGVKVGGELFSDALSAPDGPAATYLDMFRHNVTRMTQAMRGATKE